MIYDISIYTLEFKILNFSIIWGYQKMKDVWGMKILRIFFFLGGGGVTTKLD